MKIILNKYLINTAVLGLFLAVYAAFTHAQPQGMMRHGMMDDDERQQMMQQRGYMGYGPGWGTMGSMMRGPMMGGGFMMPQLRGLELNKEQRDKVRTIHREMRKKHFALMEKIMDQSDKLAELYDTDKPDPNKIGKVYDEIFKTRREMIQQHIEARNRIYDLLSKEQQEKFRANDPFSRHFGMMY